MPDLMKTLNNIFYDEEIINEFRNYLSNKRFYRNAELKNKFRKEPYNKFKLQNDQIIYQPTNLIVIEDDEQKQEALNNLFNDDTNILGKGVVAFYKYVISKYINITRTDVNNFLATKGFYQMTQSITKKINKPIIAKYPNQLWGIDLIDMNDYIKENENWRYVVTVVDIFSRKVFLNKMKLKDAETTRDAFAEIINDAGVSPKYLMSDNGKEWLGEFKEFCKENEIKQIFTRSYSPEANGVVERMNKEIRKIIRAFFVRNFNKKWFDILDKVADNKNDTFNSSVKNSPSQIWSADKEELEPRILPEFFNRDNPKLIARYSLIKKAIQKIKKFKEEDNYQVGELVRVKMSSIFTNVRRLVKEGNTKQIVVTYTPEIFRIDRVIVPRNKLLERKRYMLTNQDNLLLAKKGSPIQFYASELLRFKGEDATDIDYDMNDALKMNGVEPNANDVDY
jgi:hypothetical protein